mmetsp:Transcript_31146/g.26602  ORF Transcript_31146/g.26602 Transcript_31146/m.26602 type:complete len:126 (+) Transcript_31146:3-380(+)
MRLASPLLRSLDRDYCVEALACLMSDACNDETAYEIVRRCWQEQERIKLYLAHESEYRKAMLVFGIPSSSLVNRLHTRELPPDIVADLATLSRAEMIQLLVSVVNDSTKRPSLASDIKHKASCAS